MVGNRITINYKELAAGQALAYNQGMITLQVINTFLLLILILAHAREYMHARNSTHARTRESRSAINPDDSCYNNNIRVTLAQFLRPPAPDDTYTEEQAGLEADGWIDTDT